LIKNFHEVSPDLYRGAAPSPQDLIWLKDNFGIKKIVSLDETSGEKIKRAVKLLGIKQIKLYIEGHTSLIKALGHNLKTLFEEGGPTFVHCKYGCDRTGLLVALYKCKYMGMDPEDAIKEAKSLGFGVGIHEKITALYEKLIRQCKSDNNNADIVSNERDYKGDNRDTFLDESFQHSFSPYLDATMQAPYDSAYKYIVDQSPTRENFDVYKHPTKNNDEENVIPQIGIYNNDAGISGGAAGPVYPAGGFLYD